MEISPMIIPILGISCGLLAIFGGVFVLPFFKLKQRQLELNAQNVAEKAAQYASNQGILEERVAVLERIITDQGYSLAKEIEELRSLPPRSVTPQQDLI
jgi:hypothetical protein